MENIISMINEYSAFLIIGLAIIVFLLFIIVLVFMQSLNKVEKKYKRMMRGVNNKNLEALITSKLDDIDKAVANSEESLNRCEVIKEEMKECVNKVAIMRYRAFEDIGSDLSFSIAILDSNNDGVMLTGIYSRQESTTYAKPIDKGISRYELSEEELHVLNEAINK
ncbi:DUF4446 family protein [Clostridium chauvoei]|uniref:DUF4446 domain-containing protein n=2 Tax=Clostridium chauvoei TaxID=46867 RepID=S6EP42_9CLOT|nr:DUF4446 family protein [Clostridium chauvoei]ATD56134.1 hypothetical protein BTM20_13420 [Clostridium chauvoei]ATD58624.1 hypothetical protein BTM21_13445 [Clostridium chauvoei]MBX7281429.1 DUF4446 family protein [Clostridium chauvoei]MBX7283949.1 DUF4446 family protein [Clostridium chauvoei]MBX7286165.1 DUF4446 family protein [Clostridium chauvoei]